MQSLQLLGSRESLAMIEHVTARLQCHSHRSYYLPPRLEHPWRLHKKDLGQTLQAASTDSGNEHSRRTMQSSCKTPKCQQPRPHGTGLQLTFG